METSRYFLTSSRDIEMEHWPQMSFQWKQYYMPIDVNQCLYR